MSAIELDVCVVGSVNVDLTIPARHLPRPGETLLGGTLRRQLGGKGANQAVAASRLGRRTSLIGCLGTDTEADLAAESLANEGVDLRALVRTETPTGTAIILLTEGESSIVVSPGANYELSDKHVDEAAAFLRGASSVLTQLEIPLDTVKAAARHATGLFLLNPAPAMSLPPGLLGRVDVLTPNRTELAVLAGGPIPEALDDAVDLARTIPTDAAIIVTLGAEGALVVHKRDVFHVRAQAAALVDATGAGDSFTAAIADALLDGASLDRAAVWACRVAASTVERPGAFDSFPAREELEPLSSDDVGELARAWRPRPSTRMQHGEAKPLAEWLPEASPAWKNALSMRFIADLAAARLPDQALARYFHLENSFIDIATEALANAVRLAPKRASREALVRMLTGLTTEQYAYFAGLRQTILDGSMPGPNSSGQANQLKDFMKARSSTQSYSDILVCTYAAELLYSTWCSTVVVNPEVPASISTWIELHRAQPFREGVAWLKHEVSGLDPTHGEQREHLAQLFNRTLELEIQFHEACYFTD